MDESEKEIELLINLEKSLEDEIVRSVKKGMTAQAASRQADLDEIRAKLAKLQANPWGKD